MLRAKIIIHGAVQGVGFRPFVYKLANELGVTGSILNSSEGVYIDAEADSSKLQDFIKRLETDKPAISHIQSLETIYLDLKKFDKFEILKSNNNGSKTALILPDIATCDDCIVDIFDNSNRRYQYPFTNCTNCGPRFTIIERLPYDRQNTSMKIFSMCDECRAEYEDPGNRRFHAQPNACPKCGPKITLTDASGKVYAEAHEALLKLIDAIKQGKIAAVKGLGGFHLVADARNEESISKLRERKHREEKPLALMFPDVTSVFKDCEISKSELRALTSVERPIILLQKKEKVNIADNIAPGNPYLGVMLPYTPLHHLIMKGLNFPIAATSGNLSEEPICIDNDEALIKLGKIADVFLMHDRPILRHADDSIVRIIDNKEMMIRRARGFAPLPIKSKKVNQNILAVGGHLKNSVALNIDDNIFISQHIGDLETEEAYKAFDNVINDLSDIYDIKPGTIACDMHPDYISTTYANKIRKPLLVQHHYAHILSCMTENEIEEECLGIAWDGTGYGTDGTIWGGEFLITSLKESVSEHSKYFNDKGFRRFAHLRTFKLPGGDKAIKDISRTLAGLLYKIYGDNILINKGIRELIDMDQKELEIICKMLYRDINSPYTSSAGRLFDAAASIIRLTRKNKYEGKAAMMLEFLISDIESDEHYPFELIENNNEVKYIVDWEKLFISMINDIKNETDKKIISIKFHNTLCEVIKSVADKTGLKKIILSGGVFQNRYLIERTIKILNKNGYQVYHHQRVPTNDGGISLGQIAAAKKELEKCV